MYDTNSAFEFFRYVLLAISTLNHRSSFIPSSLAAALGCSGSNRFHADGLTQLRASSSTASVDNRAQMNAVVRSEASLGMREDSCSVYLGGGGEVTGMQQGQ